MSEISFTAKQAAAALGSSPAQARRYGAALEEVTGEPIARHPRDGRMYRRDQIETMLKAKELVEANPGLTITQALTLALGNTPELARADSTAGLNLPSEALSEALERALARSLLPELQGLRAEVAALRSELAAARALPPDTNPNLIDKALEVEMLESRTASEPPVEADDRQAGVEVVNGVEPQRLEQESWMAAIALKALTTASELPAALLEGRESGESESTGEASGEAEGSSDGPIVRAARWLERRFRGK